MNVDRIIELEHWAQTLRENLPLEDALDVIKARMQGANDDDSYQLALILKNVLIDAGHILEGGS